MPAISAAVIPMVRVARQKRAVESQGVVESDSHEVHIGCKAPVCPVVHIHQRGLASTGGTPFHPATRLVFPQKSRSGFLGSVFRLTPALCP